jgi:hypothetical protein
LLVKYDPRDLSRIFVRQPGWTLRRSEVPQPRLPASDLVGVEAHHEAPLRAGLAGLERGRAFRLPRASTPNRDAAAFATATARRPIARRPPKVAAPAEDASAGRLGGINPAAMRDDDDDMEFWVLRRLILPRRRISFQEPQLFATFPTICGSEPSGLSAGSDSPGLGACSKSYKRCATIRHLWRVEAPRRFVCAVP